METYRELPRRHCTFITENQHSLESKGSRLANVDVDRSTLLVYDRPQQLLNRLIEQSQARQLRVIKIVYLASLDDLVNDPRCLRCAAERADTGRLHVRYGVPWGCLQISCMADGATHLVQNPWLGWEAARSAVGNDRHERLVGNRDLGKEDSGTLKQVSVHHHHLLTFFLKKKKNNNKGICAMLVILPLVDNNPPPGIGCFSALQLDGIGVLSIHFIGRIRICHGNIVTAVATIKNAM